MMQDDLKVQMHQGTAVIRGRAGWSEPSGQRTQIRFTDTWLKRDGRWQCIATHESSIGTAPDDTEVSALTTLTPEHKKLAMRAGNWTWKGEQVNIDSEESPYGQGGPFSGRSEERVVLGGLFLLSSESTWELSVDNGNTWKHWATMRREKAKK